MKRRKPLAVYGHDDATVRDILRDFVTKHGTQQKFAKDHGIAASVLSDILNGRRDPTDKILSHLGLKRIYFYIEQK